jgi:hypothetical protein
VRVQIRSIGLICPRQPNGSVQIRSIGLICPRQPNGSIGLLDPRQALLHVLPLVLDMLPARWPSRWCGMGCAAWLARRIGGHEGFTWSSLDHIGQLHSAARLLLSRTHRSTCALCLAPVFSAAPRVALVALSESSHSAYERQRAGARTAARTAVLYACWGWQRGVTRTCERRRR